MNDNIYRVRFAPSPTGLPHLGNARAAIINYIFAKQHNGKFLLRIEDTDRERSTLEYKEYLFNMLKWLDIPFDEVPLIQSERFHIYAEKAKYLYDNDFAYYCTCAKIDDENIRKCDCKHQQHTSGVLRFKVKPNENISFNDIIYGPLTVNTDNIEDFALVRSDGVPTYMLCVVIDDIASNITHIIRGEDHRTNTFKQILIYNALNAKIPYFAHMPMILGHDKKKLSKRNGGSSVEYFKSIGIHYKGFINYMMRLGWGYQNQEYFTIEQLISLFKLENVKKSAAVFDINKMLKCSEFFIKNDIEHNTSYKYFAEYIKEYKNMNMIDNYNNSEYIALYNDVAKRCKTYDEIYNMIKFIWSNVDVNIQETELKAIKKIFDAVTNTEVVINIEQIIKKLVSENLHKPFRLILTGNNIGPDLTIALKCIGLQTFIKKLNNIQIS